MKIKRGLKELASLVMLAIFLFVGISAADAAYYPKKVWARISATTGQAITAGQMVAIADADGYAYKADADVSTLRPAVGIAGASAASGAKVEIIVSGVISGWSSLTEGSPGYLSETAGAVTQSTPSYSQQVGIAITSTDYFINCINYFDTTSLTALGVLSGATPIILEGATADAYETTIIPTDPTADRSITLPNASGTVSMTGGANTNGSVHWGDCDNASFDTGTEVCANVGLTCLNSWAVTDSTGAWSAAVACGTDSCGAGLTIVALCY